MPHTYNVVVFEFAYSGQITRTVVGTLPYRRALAEAESEAARRETVRQVVVFQASGEAGARLNGRRRSGLGRKVFNHYNADAKAPPPCPSASGAAERIQAELRAMRPGFYA